MKCWLQIAWIALMTIGLMTIGPLSVWSQVQRQSFDVVVPKAPIPVATEGHVAEHERP